MSNKSTVLEAKAYFAEIRQLFKEQKEYDKKMAEKQKKEQEKRKKELEEYKRRSEEGFERVRIQHEITTKQIRETDLKFNGHWGKLMETLVEGDLVKLLKQKGIQVDRTATNILKKHGEQQFEFDILAFNGEEIVVVEVKTTLDIKELNYFIKKLNRVTDFMPEFKGKKVYGAVAYLKANQSSDKRAEKEGLFVIRATGSSSSIINKQGFKPKFFQKL